MSLRPVSLSVVFLLSVSHGALAQATLPDIVVEAPRSTPDAPAQDNRWVVVDRAFSPVTVIREEEIRAAGAASLGDLLSQQPGISSSSFAPGMASRPVIRGLDNNRVRLQENGVGSGDVSDLGEDHAVTIDPLAAQSVEVVRGPAALRFGSQAIGGVVNVSNSRIPTSLGPVGVRGQLTGSGATAEGSFDGSAMLDGRQGNTAFHAEVFGRSSGDYTIPGGGTQANSFTSAQGFSLGATAFFEQGFLGASVTHIRNLYGIPGTAAANRTRINMEQTKVQTRGEYQIEGGPFEVFRFWAGGSSYRHVEENAAAGAFVGGSTFRNSELETRIEGQMRAIATPVGNLVNLFGVQAGTQSLSTAGDALGLISPADTRKLAAFLFSTLELTPTTRVQAAGRVETVTIDGTAATFPNDFLGASGNMNLASASRNFVPMSASLGLLQDLPGGMVASVTGQYVERAPRAAELFSRGPHDATTTFEIGNPNLTKESARSIEIGLKKAQGKWRFDATAFHSAYSGFIFKRLTGNQCGDDFASCGTGTELNQVVYDQRDATFTGLELRSQLDIGEIGGGIFGVEGQYDFVNAVFADSTNLPRIPPHRLGGGVYWRDSNWFARATLLHAFDQNAVGAGETPTAGYNLLNAELSYRHKVKDANSGISEIIVGLSGRNLLDETIRNHISFTKNDVVAPGRSLRAFATVKF